MSIRLGRGLPLLVGMLAIGAFCAQAEEEEAPPSPPTTTSYKPLPSDAVAKKIDEYINKRIEKEKLSPAPVADDAEWLRRVWLDVAGGQPEPNEVIAFLASSEPDKRRRKLDELLAKEDFSRNWAEFWTDVMEGEATTKRREDQIKVIFRNWFQDQLAKDTPFDELTRRVISAEGYIQDNGAVGYLLSYTDMGNQPDPKTLASTTARVFMGLQIECAQCHDHPFADWKREEFMSLAAFFGRARRDQKRLMPDFTPKELAKLSQEERDQKKREFQKKQQMQPYGVRELATNDPKGDFYAEVQTVRNPGEKDPKKQPPGTMPKPQAFTQPTDPKKAKKPDQKPKPVEGKYFVAPQFIVPALKINGATDAKQRELLGKLITDPKNPFFAKNCANRIWGRLTGRPLVAPSEDMSDASAPHDSGLLDLLAKGFRDLKCDHRAFVRAICLSDAYARSSRTTVDHSDKEAYAQLVRSEQLYAVGVVRPIDARPLARSIVEAITLGARTLDDVAEGRMQQGLLVRFERLFGESNLDPKKYEETIPQALFLINGQGTNRGGPLKKNGKPGGKEGAALTAPPSAATANLLQKYDDPRERITRIYLAALCRPPRKAELEDATAFVKESGGEGDAYEDVLWALVNSAEFRFNR